MSGSQPAPSQTKAAARNSTPPVTCPFCNRSGLPLLPLRYAVVRTDKGHAPDLSPPFNAGKIALPADSAKYSLRVLRPGYLYMFDEKRGEWTAYVVTPEAYLYQFDISATTPPQVPEKAFNEACMLKGDPYKARCVNVKDAENAGNIWLGFSDVLWTKDVLANHAKADYRKNHMRCINMADVRAKKTVAHADTFAKLKQVAEFTRKPSPAPEADRTMKRGDGIPLRNVTVVYDLPLSFSHQPLNQLGDQAQGLTEWAAHAGKPNQPMMVALSDPSGIATELALLMQTRLSAFMHDESHDPDRVRKTVLSAAIEQLQDGVKTQAQQDYVDAGEKAAREAEIGRTVAVGGIGAWIPGDAKLAAMYRQGMTAERVDKAGNDAWAKYSDMYSEPARTTWQNEFNKALENFDAAIIAPLALAHRDWMKSDPTAHYFSCNYDTAIAKSGVVYTAVITQCIAGTQDKKPCGELYTAWLQGSLIDKRNLLLRALCLNHDVLAKEVEDASQASVTWAGLAWDKLFSVGETISGQLVDQEKQTWGLLTVAASGAITAALRKVSESGRIYAGLVALGVMARAPFVPVTIEGSKKAFRALLIKNMLKMSGAAKSIPKNKLELAVANELRRQEIIGVDTKGNGKKTWLLMVDPDQVGKMPKGLTAEGRAKWLAGSIRTPEQVDELNLASFRETVAQGGERVKLNLPFGFAVLGLLANCWAMQSILKDDEAALEQHKSEARRRVWAQGIWVVGAAADAMATGLTRLTAGGIRFGQAALKMTAAGLELFGRVLGAVGGVLMAVWDGWRAYEEAKAGHMGGLIAYSVSAFLGGAATALLALGWTGWGLIVVGLLFLWAFISLFLVHDKIQDWLELCYWGKSKNPTAKYRSTQIEMQQLDLAIKG